MRIDVTDIGYTTGQFTLGPLSLSVEEKEIFGIGGPNGSGKTTLMRLMLGLIKPTTGIVRIGSRRIQEMTPAEISRRVAYLPQHLFSPLNLSVADVLLASQYSMLDDVRLHSIVSEFNLDRFMHRDFNSLSGGEKRMVMFAGALSQGADTIVMDEPDTFLDIDMELKVMSKLRKIKSEGKTVVVIFHDLNKLSSICDRVAMLKDGRLHSYGLTDEVFVPENLEDIYSARFFIEQDKMGRRIFAKER